MQFLTRQRLLLLCLLLPFFAFSQSNKIRFAEKSSWVKTITYNDKARPDEGQSSSSYYLLIDEQENTVKQEKYFHYAYVLLTSEGLQEMSDLSFDYDPTYQEMIFHEVKIVRNGTTINKLTRDIRSVQREQSMDRYLYDGTQTAIINLKDVRKGDIIEYSYTRKGNNPVYDGHISRTLYFNYGAGYEKQFIRIVLPATKVHTLKVARDEESPYQKEQSGKEVSYTWTFDRAKALLTDSNIPGWYDPYSYMMITDFSSWQDVAKWASTLFEVSETDLAQIKSLSASTFKETEEEKYIPEVIRFVQDEVRYLGFETGLNSHKPYSPLKVFQQRYGDCKDKSLLLVTLLRARGIEAYPVLVNTSMKDKIAERLPAANVFDHCVVKIKVGEYDFYIDPTISNQGGRYLHNIYFPDYRQGLVIDPATTDLEIFPDLIRSSTTELQTFDVFSIGGEAMFSVKTTYTGNDADYQRGEFSRNNLETVQKNYLNYYANLYPDITKWEDLTVKDSRDSNVLIVEEKYKIPTFWRPEEGEANIIACKVYPQTLEPYFTTSKSAERTAPYRLSYPVDYYHDTKINLPETWNIESKNVKIESDFYEYEYNMTISGTEISRSQHYRTKKDNVPVEHRETYMEDHKKMMNNLECQLTYNKDIAEANDSHLPGVITSIVSVIIGVYLMFALYRKYDPEPPFRYLHGTPIGGWLIVLAIGVSLAPLWNLVDLAQNAYAISGEIWMIRLAAKQYGLFALTFFMHVYNILHLLFAALLVILFFQRRSSFPRLMTIQLVTTTLVMITDIVISRSIADDPASIPLKDTIQATIGAAIWIPYLHMSQRVKETFVIRSTNHDDKDQENESVLVEEAKNS